MRRVTSKNRTYYFKPEELAGMLELKGEIAGVVWEDSEPGMKPQVSIRTTEVLSDDDCDEPYTIPTERR